MKISQLLAQKRPMLSFEVFPPKSNARFSSTMEAAQEIALLQPPFMSVTYVQAAAPKPLPLRLLPSCSARWACLRWPISPA